MSQRSKTIGILAEYFESKGGILSPKEYRKQKDTPIRLENVKRVFGNWSRMEKIVRAFNVRNENKPEPTTNARQIVMDANSEAAQKEALIRSVAEDLDQKTAREEAARAQIESDALNAKTAEGARENKVRKGGPESLQAKVIKESLSRAVAEEHAMLAKTAAGSAEGKELLGGVEDLDAKNEAIARANARTERSALLTATPEGAALAMLEEDDSDGHLTREAQHRVRNELRPYTDPATDENIGDFVAQEGEKLRAETREALSRIEDTETDMSMSAALRGERARDAVGAADISKETDTSKAPPADQELDPKLTGFSEEAQKEAGVKLDPKPKQEEPTDQQDKASGLATSKGMGGPTAAENKDTVNKAQNKENPEAPPADRNPDPKLRTTGVKPASTGEAPANKK